MNHLKWLLWRILSIRKWLIETSFRAFEAKTELHLSDNKILTKLEAILNHKKSILESSQLVICVISHQRTKSKLFLDRRLLLKLGLYFDFGLGFDTFISPLLDLLPDLLSLPYLNISPNSLGRVFLCNTYLEKQKFSLHSKWFHCYSCIKV